MGKLKNIYNSSEAILRVERTAAHHEFLKSVYFCTDFL